MKSVRILATMALFPSLLFAGRQPAVTVTAPEGVSVEVTVVESTDDRPLVQIAVLLDTSSSMSGMINQAKTQLWSIINEFLEAKRGGVAPRLEVAMYHYGSPNLGQKSGYIKQLTPFTEDLDKVSQELFRLGTQGGDEYCGWVIQTALNELEWSDSHEDYKAIFIAGNEPFTQGPVSYKSVCKQAASSGILMNTIHCSGGSAAGWREGALLTDGRALKIDTERVVVEVETPYDKEIAELGVKINETYIVYGGEKGKEAADRQVSQDRLSQSLSLANFSKRARTKGSAYYKNDSWDLVDATKEKGVKLAEMEAEDLPDAMREMSGEEREAYVAEMAAKRAGIQKQIAELSVKREQFVSKKRAELAGNENTLGEQVRATVRGQAEATGFTF